MTCCGLVTQFINPHTKKLVAEKSIWKVKMNVTQPWPPEKLPMVTAAPTTAEWFTHWLVWSDWTVRWFLCVDWTCLCCCSLSQGEHWCSRRVKTSPEKTWTGNHKELVGLGLSRYFVLNINCMKATVSPSCCPMSPCCHFPFPSKWSSSKRKKSNTVV